MIHWLCKLVASAAISGILQLNLREHVLLYSPNIGDIVIIQPPFLYINLAAQASRLL